jgi:transcriptional regulator GlxA family with amidase domain
VDRDDERASAVPETAPIQEMRTTYSLVDVRDASLVEQGRIITGGGVSLCIDTTLHLVQRLFGESIGAEVARSIEYHRAWAANKAQFPPVIGPHRVVQVQC